MENNYLSFLENALPNAAKCAKQLEQLFFTDANSAMAKARLFIEDIISSVWSLENLNKFDHDSKNLSERIVYLYRENYFEQVIYNSLSFIRKIGDSAVHATEVIDIKTAYTVHKEMYIVGKWYFELYTCDESLIPAYEQPQQPKLTEELIEEKKKAMFESMLAKKEISASVATKEQVHEEAKDELQKIYEEPSDNYLAREITKLKISSAEAVENANSFSTFKNYLHVKRPIQEKIEEVLEYRVNQNGGNLILLCGSVGDGKSHLLAYLNHHRKDVMQQYRVFNDATESFSPTKTALETLEELLKNFSDQLFDESDEKIIIAINMGVLNNFIQSEHNKYTYNRLKQFIEESDLFTSKILTHIKDGPFDLISFSDYQMYELTPSGAESSYFSSLIHKICNANEQNPFYLANRKDLENGKFSIIHENYNFLCNPFVQKQIVQLVIQVIIQNKHNISSRHFLNFIADLLIPHDFKESEKSSDFDRLLQTLPNLLFNSKDRSQLLDHIRLLNPMHYRIQAIDEVLVTLNTLKDWSTLFDVRILDEVAKLWLEPFTKEVDFNRGIFETLIVQLITTMYLTDESFAKECSNEVFEEYLEYVYSFNKNQKQKIKDFYKNLRTAIFNWKGSPLNEHIYLNRLENEFAIVQRLKLNPRLDEIEDRPDVKLQTFKPYITVMYLDNDKNNKALLDIDYALFRLLYKVKKGYRPNKKDEEDATTFVEFLEKLMEFGNKKDEVIFDFIGENKKYRLMLDEFQDQGFVFEKVE
ncbi:DNA phosphorothioation-dependent restriction protein DptF [Lysinibacillus fusiformis]|uniref:DNA phosphorothioation-dependent restriction protein DptF n=1 Tax=Lysinibacillus fusiformis TaxID=28031 RepID=UPI003D088190